jgi:hypothetical protein
MWSRRSPPRGAGNHHGLRVEGGVDADPNVPSICAAWCGPARNSVLSIDYFADVARTDGAGGRFLDRITVVGGAVTPKPMNAGRDDHRGQGHVGRVRAHRLACTRMRRPAVPTRTRSVAAVGRAAGGRVVAGLPTFPP